MPTKEKSAPPRAVAAKPAKKAVAPKTTAIKTAAPKATATTSAAVKSPVTTKAAPIAKTPQPVKASAPKAVSAPAPAPVIATPAPAPAKVEAPRPVVVVKALDAPVAAKAAAPVIVPGAEALPKVLKGVATTNVATARDAFAVARQSTEAFAVGFGSGGEAAAKGMKSFQAALMEAIQANTDATLGYWRSLSEVKTLSDAIELQAHTARRQFEALSAQAKTLAGIASRTAQETTAPVRKALDTTLSHGS